MDKNNEQELMVCFILYYMFYQKNGKHAIAFSTEMEINVNDELEKYLRTGCAVHQAYLENKADLNYLISSQYEFERIRMTNTELHKKMKAARQKFQSRWSNDKKFKINPQITSASCLPKPSSKETMLAKLEACSVCARLLNQVGKSKEATIVMDLISRNVTT